MYIEIDIMLNKYGGGIYMNDFTSALNDVTVRRLQLERYTQCRYDITFGLSILMLQQLQKLFSL